MLWEQHDTANCVWYVGMFVLVFGRIAMSRSLWFRFCPLGQFVSTPEGWGCEAACAWTIKT